MFAENQYELIDFGEGRKLERFGPVLLDRPAPAAQGLSRRIQSRWKRADFIFHEGNQSKSQWKSKTDLPQNDPNIIQARSQMIQHLSETIAKSCQNHFNNITK